MTNQELVVSVSKEINLEYYSNVDLLDMIFSRINPENTLNFRDGVYTVLLNRAPTHRFQLKNGTKSIHGDFIYDSNIKILVEWVMDPINNLEETERLINERLLGEFRKKIEARQSEEGFIGATILGNDFRLEYTPEENEGILYISWRVTQVNSPETKEDSYTLYSKTLHVEDEIYLFDAVSGFILRKLTNVLDELNS